MIALNSIDKSKIGLFGSIFKLDISALLMAKIKSVQVGRYETLADPQVVGNFPAPATSEVTLAVLESYLNDPDSPRLAFNCGAAEISVFCKNTAGISAYDYGTNYFAGDYVIGLIGGSRAAIFLCITGGTSDSEEELKDYDWEVTGTITENHGVEWQFVDYQPIIDEISYDANTMISFAGLRDSQSCSLDADKLDVPDKDIGLVLAYATALAWQVKKQTVPIKIQNIIDKEELRIINESD